MKLLIRRIRACGVFIWSTVELLNNDNIKSVVGNSGGLFDKLLFILPHILLVCVALNLITIWDDFDKKQMSLFSRIRAVILIIFP